MADFPHNDTSTPPVDASPFDAYRPPPVSLAAPPAEAESTLKAGRIKALCIIIIVLAGLGLASALMGAVGLLVGQQMQGAFTMGNQPGVPKRVQDLQRDMQRGMQAVQDRYLAVNAVLLAGHVIVAAGLLVGGIQSLRRRIPGRKILIAACLSAIAFELIRGTVQAFIQVQVMSVMSRFFQEMMEVSMNEAAEVAEWVAWGARAAMVVGVLMLIGWILAKVVFYSVTVWYLRKLAVRQYLDAAEVTAVVVA
jgi:hypothetical protein